MKQLYIFLSLLAVIALACSLPGNSSTGTQPAGTAIQPPVQVERKAEVNSSAFDSSKLGTVEKDVTYCTMEGVALKMDLHYPSSIGAPWAVTMYVHGGGWTKGDKR